MQPLFFKLVQLVSFTIFIQLFISCLLLCAVSSFSVTEELFIFQVLSSSGSVGGAQCAVCMEKMGDETAQCRHVCVKCAAAAVSTTQCPICWTLSAAGPTSSTSSQHQVKSYVVHHCYDMIDSHHTSHPLNTSMHQALYLRSSDHSSQSTADGESFTLFIGHCIARSCRL